MVRIQYLARGLYGTASVAFVVAAMTPAPAFAQSSDSQRGEEISSDSNIIVVTAQKREQDVSDIGLSVTAVGGEELASEGISSIDALATKVPNVIATTSANLPAFTIRGIGLNEFASNFDSPVAVHIDEVYKSKPYMVSIPFFDVNRVEALKGPQGTTFGRNATGGAVNIYTNEPEFNTSGGVGFSLDNHGRATADGFVNASLSDDVALRLSTYVAQGFGGPYEDTFNGGDYGNPDQLAGRLQLKFNRGNTTVKLSAHGFRDKSELTPYKSPGIFTAAGGICPQLLAGTVQDNRGACQRLFGPFIPANAPDGTLVETQDPREVNSNAGWLADNTAYGFSGRIEHDLGNLQLVSISAYDYFERRQVEDATNSPITLATQDYYSRIKQFTQELRIVGEAGPLNFLIGGFYEDDSIAEVNSSNAGFFVPLLGLPPFAPRLGAQFEQDTRSFAFFTNNELEITPTVRLVAGVRYTNDRTKVDGDTFLGADDPTGSRNEVTQVIPVDALVASRTDENVSFRGGINWDVAPDHLLYASVARGFRSGGYSVPFGGAITTFEPEKLTAYEVGYKGQMMNGDVRLNIAGYLYDYKNLQVNVDDVVSPLVPITRNIGSARNIGIEGDVTYSPDRSLVLRASAGYLDAKYRQTDRVITTYAGPISLQGRRPVNSPEFTAQVYASKSLPVGDNLELTFQTDGRYTGSRFLEATGQPFDRAGAYWLQNARISLGSNDAGWEFSVWGKNILDEEYLTYVNNVSFFRLEILGDPASFGVSARFSF